jgi:hypothetical protein
MALVLLTLDARATTPEVEAGKDAFINGDFRTALTRLDAAARSPSCTEDDLVEIHWYRAAAYHALGKNKQAAKSFDELIEIRPLYSPGSLETPPDLRAAFRKRADEWHKQHGVTFSAPTFETTSLTASLNGHPQELHSAFLYARAPGEVTYRQFELRLTQGKSVTGEINDVQLWERVAQAGGALEYVLEGRNARGTPVARLGDAREPAVLKMAEAQLRAAMDSAAAAAPNPGPQAITPASTTSPRKGGTSAAGKSSESVLPRVAGALGGGFLALGGITFMIGAVSLLAAALSWSTFGLSYYVLSRPGLEKEPQKKTQWETAWWVAQVGGYALVPVAVAGLVLTLGNAAVGGGLLLVRWGLG